MKNRFIFILMLLSNWSFSQSITLLKYCQLPELLRENSGMIALNDSTLIFHNDSGNKACLYMVNHNCELLDTFCLKGIKNVDWEDITMDTKGHIYIADLGNNQNKRDTVWILRINTSHITHGETLQIDSISIVYQDIFPPGPKRKMYDVEALYWHNDSLFFLSKNRREPFDGISWVFGIPDKPGFHHLQPMDSIKIPGVIRHLSWVTAADYEPSSRLLLILGSNQLTAIHHAPEEKPYHGSQTTFDLGAISQKEAIAFSPTMIFISDEDHKKIPGRTLYMLPKKLLYKKLGLDIMDLPLSFDVRVPEKVTTDSLEVTFVLPYDSWAGWELLDYSGLRVKVGKPKDYPRGFHRIYIPIHTLDPAHYVFNLIIDDMPHAFQIGKKWKPED
ncbi:MAG: hypothetical protein JJU02_15740 [Cryomorphaceae bacterium]|nr:hypothetical protein [Cryomorphaceae bacterium]